MPGRSARAVANSVAFCHHVLVLPPQWGRLLPFAIRIPPWCNFLCPQKFVFCTQNAFFAQTPRVPNILCPDPSLFAHKFSQRVLFSETFATFRTQSRRSYCSGTSPEHWQRKAIRLVPNTSSRILLPVSSRDWNTLATLLVCATPTWENHWPCNVSRNQVAIK